MTVAIPASASSSEVATLTAADLLAQAFAADVESRSISADQPGSPGWWLKALQQRMATRNAGTLRAAALKHDVDERPGLLALWSWYRGYPPLPAPAKGWQEQFREFLALSVMNYAELVVEPPRIRLQPLGWRTAAAGDEAGDALASRVARANEFGSTFGDCMTDVLALADGYMAVGEPHEDLGGMPVITAESPLTTITADDSATRRTRAALKVSVDEWTGLPAAHLFLPGHVLVARRDRKRGTGWTWDEAESGPLPAGLENAVPIVHFRNRGGTGEFEPHLGALARINNLILDRVVISKIQAFRQRAIEGLPNTDAQGQEIDYSGVFAADPGALWQVPAGVKFWESAPVDLNPLRMAIRDDVEALAAVTSTPLHLITPDAASGSAEGASTMRESLVFRVEDRRLRVAGSLARVMAMAFRVLGDAQRADVSQIETLWAPAERFSLAERSDAASKLWGKLPAREVFTDVLQYPVDALPRLQAGRAEDLLFAPVETAAAGVAR